MPTGCMKLAGFFEVIAKKPNAPLDNVNRGYTMRRCGKMLIVCSCLGRLVTTSAALCFCGHGGLRSGGLLGEGLMDGRQIPAGGSLSKF